MTKIINKKEDFDSLSEDERLNCVLSGVFYYSCVHSPNYSSVKKFKGKPCFKVTLGLEGDEVKKASDMGFVLKEPTEDIPHPHIDIKRDVHNEAEIDKYRPKIVDSLQNDIPSSILIGNGSRGLVKFHRYWIENPPARVGGVLLKLQVRELVRFVPDETDKDLVIDEEGFSVSDLQDGEEASDTDTSFDDVLKEMENQENF